MRNRRRGMSLVEMMVTLGIVTFAASGAFLILVAGKRAWLGNVGRAEVRQTLQVAVWRLDNELRNSAAGFVTVNAVPPAFSFPSTLDAKGRFTTETDGVPNWQKYVIYYVPTGTKRLLRKEVFAIPTDPDIDPVLTPAELTGYCDGRGSLVADSVAAFGLALDPDAGTGVLTLTLERRNANGAIERQGQTTTIFLRN